MAAAHPSAGRLDGREHVMPIRVYYEDTDLTGVVYHGRYVGLFDRGRTECLRAVGVGHAELLGRDQPVAFTVVRMAMEFRRPARIDDALEVRTTYDMVRGPRLFVSQRIVRDAHLVAAAEVEIACIDLSGRPRKPPKALLDAVAPLLIQHTP